MGLAERRATKAFQDNELPKLQKALDDAAGFPVTLEIDWENLAQEGYADHYNDWWKSVYFTPVTRAIKEEIAIDEMGQEALKEKLKKIVFTNRGGYYSPESAINWKDGVLTVDHSPSTNVDYIDDRKQRAASELLKNL
jgi:hypothetical protein